MEFAIHCTKIAPESCNKICQTFQNQKLCHCFFLQFVLNLFFMSFEFFQRRRKMLKCFAHLTELGDICDEECHTDMSNKLLSIYLLFIYLLSSSTAAQFFLVIKMQQPLH